MNVDAVTGHPAGRPKPGFTRADSIAVAPPLPSRRSASSVLFNAVPQWVIAGVFLRRSLS
jgi:hypothetical protein